LLDRYAAYRVMTAGGILGVVGLAAVATAPNLGWFFAAWLLVGTAQAATLYQAAFTVINRTFGSLRVRALTVLTLAAGLASTIFAPVASTLAGALGWRAGFLVLAGSIRGSRSRVAGNRRRTAGSPDRRGDTSRRRARIADPHPSRGGRRTLGNSQAWPAQRYFHCTDHRRHSARPRSRHWAGNRHWVLSRGAAGRRGRMRSRHDRRCRQWFTRSNRRLRLSVHLIGADRNRVS
jgi:hypothetical protein